MATNPNAPSPYFTQTNLVVFGDAAPAPASNPPDPQVPPPPSAPPLPSPQDSGVPPYYTDTNLRVFTDTGVVTSAPAVAAPDPTLRVYSDSEVASNPAPVDLDQDPYVAEEQALANELAGDGVTVTSIQRFPNTVDTAEDPADAPPEEAAPAASQIKYSAADLDALAAANGVDQGDPVAGGITEQQLFNNENAAQIAAGTQLARQQSAISAQRGQQQQSDWRVRLQLAQGANYLYKAANPGILQPLQVTDGIIFPYTPKIDMSYKANYSSYELTHSNYKGYFYQNSAPGDVTVTAHFTAQDTAQANYVLAVIHFFRSATKMFYGQDAQRGSPPPLVFLSGLGQYQFNQHPCLISEFTYSLPDEVDYIRAQTTNQAGLNLTSVNSVKQSVSTSTIFSSISRLANAFTTKGALPTTPFGSKTSPNLAQGSPTYVPTKIDITVRLLPVNTRSQVSQQFSVKGFANGDLLRGGFW